MTLTWEEAEVAALDRPEWRRSVMMMMYHLVQIGDQLSLTLTISLTLPDPNLTIFPSIPCLLSGRRSEPIILWQKNTGNQQTVLKIS